MDQQYRNIDGIKLRNRMANAHCHYTKRTNQVIILLVVSAYSLP